MTGLFCNQKTAQKDIFSKVFERRKAQKGTFQKSGADPNHAAAESTTTRPPATGVLPTAWAAVIWAGLVRAAGVLRNDGGTL